MPHNYIDQVILECPVAIIYTDKDGVILKQNLKAQSYFGKQSVSLNIRSLMLPNQQYDFMEILEYPDSSTCLGYMKNQRNTPFFVQLSASVSEDHICWYIENQQMTLDLKNTLENYRVLPSEYGHELNNLLTIIISAGELIQMDATDSQLLEDVQGILDASYRAANKTRSFLDLGRKLFSIKKNICLADMIKNNTALLLDCVGGQYKLLINEIEPDFVSFVPPASLQNLLLQICLYLRLKERGKTVSLLSTRLRLEPPFSSQHLGIMQGEYIALSFVEEGYDYSLDKLTCSNEIISSRSETLSHAWESALRCGGALSQRVNKNGTLCLTIYLPYTNVDMD